MAAVPAKSTVPPLASKLPAVMVKFPLILMVLVGAVKTAPVFKVKAPPTLKVIIFPAFHTPATVKFPVEEKEVILPKFPPLTVKAVVAKLLNPVNEEPILRIEVPLAKDKVPVPVKAPLIVMLLGIEGLLPKGKLQFELMVLAPV